MNLLQQLRLKNLGFSVDHLFDVCHRALKGEGNQSNPSMRVLEFEQRELLSASPLGAVVDLDVVESMGTLRGEQNEDASDVFGNASASNSHSESPALSRIELVFIDKRIEGYQQLYEEVMTGSGEDDWVVLLEPDEDGIEVITSWISQHESVDAIHLLTHGTDGRIGIGDQGLSTETVANYEAEFALWRQHLSADADIYVYGCDLAGNASGQELMRTLSEMTDADIAASSDPTGHDSLGGDWELEVSIGNVEASVLVSDQFQSDWNFILDDTPPEITVVGDSSVTAGEAYTIQVSVIDPDNNPISSWTVVWGDGTENTYTASELGSVQHTYSQSGAFDILVSVVDDTGTYFDSNTIVPSQNSDRLSFHDSEGQFLYESNGANNVHGPEDVALGPDGLLYVSSHHDGSIRKYDPQTGDQVGGVFFDVGQRAVGLVFDSKGNLFVSDRNDHHIYKIDPAGNGEVFVQRNSNNDLETPMGLAFGPDGNLYVADWGDDSVKVFDPNTGDYLGDFISPRENDLRRPSYLVFADDGHLFVTSQSGSEGIHKYDSNGQFVWNVTHAEIREDLTYGISVGPDGLLYVTDSDRFGSDSTYDILDPVNGQVVGELDISGGTIEGPASLFFTPELQVIVNGPPVADAGGDYQLFAGQTIQLDGSGSVADGPIVLYEWDFDYDGVNFNTDESSTSSTISATVSPTPTSRTIALRITDSFGATAIDQSQLTITPNVEINTDQFSINEGESIGTNGENVLDNDLILTPVVTSGAVLEYVADQDDPNDNVWENETGATGFDLQFSNSTLQPTDPSYSPHGIESAFLTGDGMSTANSISSLQSLSPSQSASFEIWIKPKDTSGGYVLFDVGSGSRGASLRLVGSTLYFSVTNGPDSTNSTAIHRYASYDISNLITGDPSTQPFIHVTSVVDMDSSTPRLLLYVNQNQVAVESYPGLTAWVGTDEGIAIGRLQHSIVHAPGSNPGVTDFNGEVSIFRVYAKALTNTEVESNSRGYYLTATSVGTQSVEGVDVSVAADGSFVYDPGDRFNYLANGESVTDSFEYDAAIEGTTEFTRSTVNITIHGENDTPTSSGIADQSIDSGESVSLDVSSAFDDPDTNDVLTYSAILESGNPLPSWITFDSNSGAFSMQAPHIAQTLMIIVTADDGNGGAVDETFNLTVNLSNLPADLSLENVITSLDENVDNSEAIRVADIQIIDDGIGTQLVSLAGLDADRFEIVGNELRVKANAGLDFETQAILNVSVVVHDPNLGTAFDQSVEYELTLTDSNDPPFTSGASTIYLAEDEGPVFYDLGTFFSDQDESDTELQYQLISGDAWLRASIDEDSNQLRIHSRRNRSGMGEITLLATDASGASVERVLMVDVESVNDTYASEDLSYVWGTTDPLTGDLLRRSRDVDGESLQVIVLSEPENGSFEIAPDGTFSFTPDAGFVGETEIRFVVDDGVEPSEEIVATITIRDESAGVSNESGGSSESESEPSGEVEVELDSIDPLILSLNETVNEGASRKAGASTSHGSSDADDSEFVDDYASTVFHVTASHSHSDELFAPVASSRTDAIVNLPYSEITSVPNSFFTALAIPDLMWSELDDLKETISNELNVDFGIVGSVETVTSGLVFGYAIWALRSGLLLSSVLAAMPAWTLLDPLAIVAVSENGSGGNDESLEDIVETQKKKLENRE